MVLKNGRNLLFIMLVIIVGSSCSNLFVKKKELPMPDVVFFKCNGMEYSSDKDYIRAMGTGNSSNESMSKRMADHDASVNLAKAIESYLIKIERHRDANQMQQGEAAMEWEGESLTRHQMEMNLQDVAVICSQTQEDDAIFTTMVIVEIPLQNILPAAENTDEQ